VNGSPVPVQEAVLSGQFDVSANGLLVFVAETLRDGRSLVWVNRAGNTESVMPETGGFDQPRLSPDGKRLAVTVNVPHGGGSDIWTYRLDNGAFTRFTSTGRSNSPFWTPDGGRIVFRTGSSVFWQAADGSGIAEPLLTPADPILKTGSQLAPGAWSPDGRSFAFVVHTSVANGADIWKLNASSDRTISPIVQRSGDQWGVRVSPDGRWISYASNESGRFDVYVEPLSGGAKYQVSADGGIEGNWSPVGNELFYRSDDRMMAVTIRNGPTFAVDRPHMLFRGRYASQPIPDYDVTRDGRRFLMVRPSAEELALPEISVVENWFAELKRLTPIQ